MPEHWYYIDAQVKGRVVVMVRANNQKEALWTLREGDWPERIHVDFEIEGKPIVERGEEVDR